MHMKIATDFNEPFLQLLICDHRADLTPSRIQPATAPAPHLLAPPLSQVKGLFWQLWEWNYYYRFLLVIETFSAFQLFPSHPRPVSDGNTLVFEFGITYHDRSKSEVIIGQAQSVEQRRVAIYRFVKISAPTGSQA
jgi:hypothetical protein